jgi:hypothetical protein
VAVAQAEATHPLPPPLVKFVRHPFRWIRIRVLLLVDAAILAHIGVLIVAAIYYLTTQTDHGVKHWWDTSVTPGTLRHDIRDVGEGVLASCLAQAIVWNPFTRSHQKAGRIFRQWKDKYHLPVGVMALASAALIGTAAFAIGDGILHLLSVHASDKSPIGSLWNRTATLWNSDWDKKALGFVSAFAARRPLHVVFDEAQAFFAGRRAAAGRPLRWYHPPVYQARYNYLLENQHLVRRYPLLLEGAMRLLLIIGIGLGGFGFYVLTYKA